MQATIRVSAGLLRTNKQIDSKTLNSVGFLAVAVEEQSATEKYEPSPVITEVVAGKVK